MPGHDTDGGVLVFAKAPVEGSVKTRLLPDLSPSQACELHRRLLERTLQTALASGLTVELWCGDPHPELIGLGERYGFPCFTQSGTDLGERMAFAIRSALARHHRVVLVGCDCPALGPDYLQAATAALDEYDIVLGPALDGGYVLIGATADRPEIFQGVEWGSEGVLRSTRSRIAASGFTWYELGALGDIDRPEDLVKARRQWPGLFNGI